MKMHMICAAVFAASAMTFVRAENEESIAPIPAEAAAEANAEIKVKVRSARDELKKAFKEFATEANISYGVDMPGGRFYSKGQAPVNADYSSPQFIKSRSMAYERAYLNAIANFMIDSYGRQTTAKVSEFYGNQSENAQESPVAKAKSLGEKVALLTDAKLNAALQESGVPAEKYATAGVVERRKLLQDTIAVATMNKVLHMSSGCIPVKTFEARGDDGRYYIGVVVRYDRTSIELAKCFRQKVRPAISKPEGMTLAEALPPEEEMTSNFGVRLYFDETGTPALLSFGQWGSSYTGKSAAMTERAEEQALNQARLLADSSLTAFINSFMEAAESGDVGENISEGIVFTDDGNATPESVANVADVYLKKIKMTGADTMKGRSTAYDEVLTHPNGHKVAVVVRRWSFGTVDAVNAIDTPPAPEKPKADKPAANKEGAGVRKGRTYDF